LNTDGLLTLGIDLDVGKVTIKPESDRTLDDAAAALKAASDLKSETGGHTHDVGTPQANAKLPGERAQAVMAALVERGSAAEFARRSAERALETLP
jgi:outer membrane protein OmpA-like peptidoglycan-associated protein